jgi:RNA polymerase sigma-70 factor, ECF subfamily
MSNAMLLYAYMSDKELIDKVNGGNKPCFEVLVRRHSQSLYRIGRMLGIAHNTVEDILYHAYQHSFRHLPRLDAKRPYRQWLLKQMVQASTEYIAMQPDEQQHSSEPSARSTDHIHATERIGFGFGTMHQLEKMIEGLPVPRRSIFVLFEIEGLSIKEISDLLQLPEDVVKNRLNEAKADLGRSFNNLGRAEVYLFHKSCCDMLVDRVMAYVDNEAYHVEKAMVPKC